MKKQRIVITFFLTLVASVSVAGGYNDRNRSILKNPNNEVVNAKEGTQARLNDGTGVVHMVIKPKDINVYYLGLIVISKDSRNIDDYVSGECMSITHKVLNDAVEYDCVEDVGPGMGKRLNTYRVEIADGKILGTPQLINSRTSPIVENLL